MPNSGRSEEDHQDEHDFPVTLEDIKLAEARYGPDMPSSK